MADGTQNDRGDKNTGVALTIAGILIVALVVGFMFMDSWNPRNDMNDLSPAAGDIRDDGGVPPAPRAPAQ